MFGNSGARKMATCAAFDILYKALPPMGVLIPLLGILILCLWSLNSYILLRHVPGPLMAAFTDLVRMSWILSDRAHEIHIDLHQKYGPLVHFGPNMVSVGDPAEIQMIYRFTGKFVKTNIPLCY